MPPLPRPILRHREALALTAVLAVALATRVVALGTIPANVMLDEADNTRNAYLVLAGRDGGFFGLDWSQAPLLSIYLLAGCIRSFGDSVAGIRSMPVLLSLASLVPFFLLARRQTGLFAAAGAALLLSTSLWYLHFSRTAWINMTAPLFALGAALFLTRALERGRRSDFVACGVFVALGAYGYPAGRSIAIAVVATLPPALLLRRDRWRQTLAGFGLALLVAGVLFSPHLRVLFLNWELSQRRMNAVSVLAGGEYLGDTDTAAILLHQVGRNLAGFLLLDSDQMGRGLWAHYLPPERTVLDHGTGVLFWIGLAAGLVRWRAVLPWWLLLIVPVLTVQVLSVQTPDAGRGLILAPFMYLFVALGIQSLLNLGSRWAPRALPAALATAILALAALNLQQYFEWIDTPQALGERQPAVALAEFAHWSRLQREDIASGGLGFVVTDWRERIDRDGCKNGALQGAVCRHAELPVAPQRDVPIRPLGEGAVASGSEGGEAAVERSWVRASGGASAAERDEARRGDLARLAQALARLWAAGGARPLTQGRIETLCWYPDDTGCALRAAIHPIPLDPRNSVEGGYWYRADDAGYTLFAVLEGRASDAERCPERPSHISLEGDLICVGGT